MTNTLATMTSPQTWKRHLRWTSQSAHVRRIKISIFVLSMLSACDNYILTTYIRQQRSQRPRRLIYSLASREMRELRRSLLTFLYQVGNRTCSLPDIWGQFIYAIVWSLTDLSSNRIIHQETYSRGSELRPQTLYNDWGNKEPPRCSAWTSKRGELRFPLLEAYQRP